MGTYARVLNRSSADSFLRLREALAARGLETVPTKSMALPPPGHVVTEAERGLLVEMGLTLAPQGLVTVGTPLGTDTFVRQFAENTIDRLSCRKLAGHLTGMAADHTQAAMLIATQSLSRRLGYLTRAVEPRLVSQAASRYDALCSWSLEHIMGLPGAAPAAVFFGDEGEHHLTLAHHQRLQTQMSLSSGGLHLASAAHTAAAAYVGSLLVTLPALLADLVADPLGAVFRDGIPHTATVRALWSATRSLGPGEGNRGISAERLRTILPPSWVDWALAAEFTVPTLATLAAHDCPTPQAREGRPSRAPGAGAQAAVTHELNRLRFEHFRFVSLPALGEGAADIGSESAALALARHRSQCGPGAMSWVAARPAEPQLVLYPKECQLALQRAVGLEHSLQSDCPMRSCGARDVSTRHARHCRRSGHITRNHHALRDTLQRLLRWVGVLSTPEDPTFFFGRHAMDLTVVAGELRQGGVAGLVTHAALLDVTTTDPHAPYNMPHSALRDGASAAAAAERKLNHYRGTFNRASAKLWPLAVEAYGRWGEPAEEFFGAMAEHAVGGRTSDRWRQKGAVLHRIRQVLSVTLQRGLHRSVRGYCHVVDLARFRAVPAAQDSDVLDLEQRHSRGDRTL